MTISTRRIFLTMAVWIVSTQVLAARAQSPTSSVAKPAQARPKVSSQISNPPGVLVRVSGEIPHVIDLTAADFAKLARHSIRAKRHDGVESTFEGVSFSDVLAAAGAPQGKELRGASLSLYVVAEAADGYTAVFALAELDSSFTDRLILIADRRDGKPLPARDGPLQIIVPGEKKHARWVRLVQRLRVGRS